MKQCNNCGVVTSNGFRVCADCSEKMNGINNRKSKELINLTNQAVINAKYNSRQKLIKNIKDYSGNHTSIYLIQSGQFLKIGVSRDPYRRQDELSTPVASRILTILPIKTKILAYKLEHLLHDIFFEYHSNREWYIFNEAICNYFSLLAILIKTTSAPIQLGFHFNLGLKSIT